MTKVKPFKAIVFNQQKIKDISRVVCPPYDVISPAKQEYFQQLDSHNFIHILLPPDGNDNKYERAGKLFSDWQKRGILEQDGSPAIYFYRQDYNLKGEKKTRYGFLALLRLQDGQCRVYTHEHTRSAAKEDRMNLLKQVKANLSPIFVIFEDKNRLISRVREKYLPKHEPFINLVDADKTTHKLWRITDPEVLKAFGEKMSDESIFIGDGHHRYEVSCNYRAQVLPESVKPDSEESANYLLSYFTNLDPSGLTIMAIHRLVQLSAELDEVEFRKKIEQNFFMEEVKDRNRFFFLIAKAGNQEHIIGMYQHKKFWLLRLKNVKLLDKVISDKPAEYRLLDVSILNYLILKNTLGLDPEDKEAVKFNNNEEELLAEVDQDSRKIAFFLNPVKIQQIIKIALAGEKMPAKSTFFYPKVLSGLAINKLE